MRDEAKRPYASGWLLVFAAGLLVVNCLIWGTLLAVGGVALLGGLTPRPASPETPAVVQAPAVPTPSSTRAPSPTLLPSPRPTYWIVNPTTSLPTLPTSTRAPAPTYTPRPATPTPWPTQVIQGANAAAKGRALMALAANGPGIPFRVVFTESEIQQEVDSYLAAHPDTPVRRVSITLTPQEAIVAGQVQISGLWIAATVHATVTARDGKPVVTITQMSLGSIPLPPAVEADLKRQLAAALTGLESLPLRFTAITLGTGRITIQGVTR